ncbi:MAG: carotenoid oxygenase family protein [Pseudomonadota bacterium]
MKGAFGRAVFHTSFTVTDMSNTLDRRACLKSAFAAMSAAAVITPEIALAGAAPADWTLGVADVDRDIAPHRMTRIHGRSPQDLAGVLYRNGPAKFLRGSSAAEHWFDGDGLMRRFALGEGEAMLSARFAETPKRRQEAAANAMIVPGFGTAAREGAVVENPDDANAANTSVIKLGGELLALWEGGSAVRMDAGTLETLGFKTFRDDLAYVPFSAHPRTEPDGSVWNFGWAGRSCVIWRIGADGTLISADVITLPRASYFHDFTMTKRHLIVVLQPWIQTSSYMPVVASLDWLPEQGTRILVIDKDDLSRVRSFELPAFSAFHFADAWEEADGTIRFDGCLQDDPSFGQVAAKELLRGRWAGVPHPVLNRITLRSDGTATLEPTGHLAEFPTSDARRSGERRRLTVHVTGYGDAPFPHAVGAFDWDSGRDSVCDFGRDHLVEEFCYVPGNTAREEDGWLIGTTLNLKARATELHVLSAGRVAAGPIISWRSNVALPLTFHGSFVQAA